jgi:O-antigen/teichoic acid export membrane protein
MAAQELAFVGLLSWWSAYTLRYVNSFEGAAAQTHFQRMENTILIASACCQALLGVATLLVFHLDLTPHLVFWTILFTVSRCTGSHLAERARARGLITAYTVTQLVGPIAGFALGYAFVTMFAATPESALAGFAVAQCLGLAWTWRVMKLGRQAILPQRAIIIQAIKFGLPLLIGGVISWVSVNGIRIIIEHVNGSDALGLISVGWGLGQRLASVAAMLVTAAAFPLAVARMRSGTREDGLRQLSAGGALLLAILAPAAVGVALVSRELTTLMIAEPFREATIMVLPIAALAGALRNFRMHFGDQSMLLLEKTHFTIWINCVEAVATVAGCAVGAINGGFLGAVLGCLFGTVVGLVFGFAMAVVKFGLPLPYDAAARIGLATAVMATIVNAVRLHPAFASGWLQLGFEIVAGGAAYFGALAMLYPYELIERLYRIGLLRRPARA